MSVPAGTDASGTNGKSGVKTLGIRFEPEDHAQLSVLAQLRGNTIADEIREAIEAHIQRAKDDPALADGATSALQEIERDATTRRTAIAALFGKPADSEITATQPTPIRRTTKSQ